MSEDWATPRLAQKLTRQLSLVCAAAVTLGATPAAAEPSPSSDEAASSEVAEAAPEHLHQVSVGFVPIYVALIEGSHGGLVDGPIDETSSGSVGVSVGYGFRVLPFLELSLRGTYVKPLTGRPALDDGLHELGLVLAPLAVLPVTEQLDFVVGAHGGVHVWRLTEIEAAAQDFGASNAAGWALGWSLGLRQWHTEHTGFWIEAASGLQDASGAGNDGTGIEALVPLRYTLGWIDRF